MSDLSNVLSASLDATAVNEDSISSSFYETGTFTPYYTSSGATESYLSDILTAYTETGGSRRFGVYTKIGNVVMMQLRVRGNAGSYQNGGATGQTLAIAGLPYRILKVPPDGTAGDAMYGGLSVGFVAGLTSYDNSSTGFKQYAYAQPDIGSNPNGVIFLRYPTTNATASISTNFFTGNTDFIIGGIYFTDGTKVT